MGEGTVLSLFVSSHLDKGGGTPARSGWWGGGTPARSGWWGYPSQVWMVGGGTPARSGWWGYPSQVWTWRGIPLTMTGWGTPPPTNIASTCYAAGGIPLAFTQEDFLVNNSYQIFRIFITIWHPRLQKYLLHWKQKCHSNKWSISDTTAKSNTRSLFIIVIYNYKLRQVND